MYQWKLILCNAELLTNVTTLRVHVVNSSLADHVATHPNARSSATIVAKRDTTHVPVGHVITAMLNKVLMPTTSVTK